MCPPTGWQREIPSFVSSPRMWIRTPRVTSDEGHIPTNLAPPGKCNTGQVMGVADFRVSLV